MGINALGRAYSLGLLAEFLGWDVRAAGPSRSGGLWPVVAETAFAERCAVATGISELDSLADWADVLVAVKMLPESFGVGIRLAADRGKPLVLDIDDPDLEQRIARSKARTPSAQSAAEQSDLRDLSRAATGYPKLVSNPVLQRKWGGEIIPHVRAERGVAAASASDGITVAFVGTPRRHKGIDVLRAAISDLSAEGYRLVVTSEPPDDARPWERWIGPTSFEEGLRLLDESDIAAVPSLRAGYAPEQLPVKLIDAMMAGRAIVASDLEPVRWALDGTGRLVRPGSTRSLRKELKGLRSDHDRCDLGRRARDVALSRFTPAAVAPAFERMVGHVANG